MSIRAVPDDFSAEWQVEGRDCPQFFTHSRNGKDSSWPGERAYLPRVSVPTWMENEAFELVAQLPAYRNIHDVVRNGLFRILWWHQQDPLLNLARYRDLALLEQHEAELHAYQEEVEHHTAEAETLLTRFKNAPARQQELADKLMIVAEHWDPADRDRLRKVIKKAMGKSSAA